MHSLYTVDETQTSQTITITGLEKRQSSAEISCDRPPKMRNPGIYF